MGFGLLAGGAQNLSFRASGFGGLSRGRGEFRVEGLGVGRRFTGLGFRGLGV